MDRSPCNPTPRLDNPILLTARASTGGAESFPNETMAFFDELALILSLGSTGCFVFVYAKAGGCVPVVRLKKNLNAPLDLLSIPQSGGKNVKTFIGFRKWLTIQ